MIIITGRIIPDEPLLGQEADDAANGVRMMTKHTTMTTAWLRIY